MSKGKRPNIDRGLLVKAIKDRIKNLKASLRHHLKRKAYAEAANVDSMVSSYLYLLQSIERGVYDILPKEKL